MASLFERLLRYGELRHHPRPPAAAHGRSARRRRPLALERLEDRVTPSGETVTAVIGTLPVGRSVTVAFNATVDSPLPKGIDRVFNQGTLSGGNFAAVRTDDPASGGTTDPTLTLVDRAPAVTAVFVNGTAWSAPYRTALQTAGLGDATLGYAVPAGASQAVNLPWTNIDQISVRFSEDVTVASAHLALTGVAVPLYGVGAFAYTAATRTATWTLSAPVAGDQLRLALDGSATGVSDSGGNRLDGEWLDGTAAFPSGNGLSGTDFSFRFNVLPGDVNTDGAVNTTDGVIVRNAAGTTINVLRDVNGSGVTDAADFAATRARIGTATPAGTPGGTPGSGWVAATTPTPPNPPGVAGTTVTATNVDSLLTDVDGDGQADPGDTVRYVITITNVSLAPNATGVTLTDTLDARMTLVPGSAHIAPLATADAYTWASNTRLDSAARGLPGLFANDTIANVTGGPTRSS
jgi:uncharacterized repeat protein (TIGR01451 family)